MNNKKCKDCKFILLEGKGDDWDGMGRCGFKKLYDYIEDVYSGSYGEFYIDPNKFGCTFWEKKK